MSDILDGIGTASEGSLWSRALEPESGAKAKHPGQPDQCRNCGTELVGAYCHACGQKGHLHRTIGAFVHDLLHGALHFEGKLWRTLPMLGFKPGRLTRRYIDGQRARFVSPMALFLFTVFLMFAVFQVLGLSTPTNLQAQMDAFEDGYSEGRGTDSDGAGATGQPATLEEAQANIVRERQALRESIASMSPGNPARSEAEAELAATEQALGVVNAVDRVGSGETVSADFYTGSGWLDDKLMAKWNENPGLMLYKLQANAYKFSWLLIPISIPFVWLLFAWKRRFKAYDHAIFVTYSLSFMTLMFIALSAMGVAGVPLAIWLMIGSFVPPVHLYKQLRHAYGLSRFSAFWRLIVLSAFIWIIIALFIQVLLMLGAF
ncbi:MAG: DUF3667 domain-containing protein [Alteraurantiacibacter sp.]